MGKRATMLFPTLLLAATLVGCSGGDPGGTTSGSGGATGGSTTSGGSSGGTTTGGQATSCDIPDAGTVSSGVFNPGNACQVCDPTRAETAWSSGQTCSLCHGTDGGAGICTELGTCCTIQCVNNTCSGSQSSCDTASSCCGIPPGNGC